MSFTQYLKHVLGGAALAGAALLAGCGGAGGAADRQAGQGIAVGEPNGAMPVTAEFVAKAQEATCTDLRNRLLMIDKRMVYWDRAGNCPDNGYARTLYGATLQQTLCSVSDSIAGPRTVCAEESARALFNTIEANRDKADLGLGSTHQVETISVPPRASAPVAFKPLDQTTRSGVQLAQTVTVRDAAAFAALWSAHAGPGAVSPPVDFSRDMVIAVFLGAQPNGCHATNIDSVSRVSDKLRVQHTDSYPGPAVLCTMAITTPAHLVVLDRSNLPVEFVAQKKLIG
ncbi:MAG: protease complex subunit PrcB family protein [Pseudomonadota bacterium]